MTNAPLAGGALSGHEKTLRPKSFSGPTSPPASPNQTSPPPPPRLRRLAAALHSLGPRPLYEYLLELADGADPWIRLERYAELAPLAEFIAGNDGDQLPPLRIVEGQR
jgi:hypothetical protein